MRYAFDFQGFIYVDADDMATAEIVGTGVLNEALNPLHENWDGDWELTGIENVPDDENVSGR